MAKSKLRFSSIVTGSSARQMPAIGKEAFLYTMMDVRENAIELFGFAQPDELSCFKMLTSVSGVGPKVGLSILSELSPEKVALAVATGDFKALTKAAGVGPKLAQRIVLEMKDKVGAVSVGKGGIELPAGAAVSAAGNAAQAVCCSNASGHCCWLSSSLCRRCLRI